MVRIVVVFSVICVGILVTLFAQTSYTIGPSFRQSQSTSLVTKWTGGAGASVRLRYPRAAGIDVQSVQAQDSQWANFQLIGPDLAPASLTPRKDRLVYEVPDGFRVHRPPEIGVRLTGSPFSAAGTRKSACSAIRNSTYIGETLFDLIALDTLEERGRGAGTLKVDGTRGSIRTVLPAPLGDADLFFADLHDDRNATQIRCKYRVPNCVAAFNWRGMQAAVVFDAWDLEHWRDRRKSAREFLDSVMLSAPVVEAREVPDRLHNCPQISKMVDRN
jgi:hypothetical protein